MVSIVNVGVVVGSQRSESVNGKIARALVALAPPTLQFDWIGIGALPIYNQDQELDPPVEWIELRKRVKAADAFLFVTPEHNRSIPAVLKNALDIASRPYGESAWSGKPGAVVSASPGSLGGFGASHHLRQVLVAVGINAMALPEVYLGEADRLLSGNSLPQETKSLLAQFMKAFASWIDSNRRAAALPHGTRR